MFNSNKLNAVLFGAYAATAVLTVYTMIGFLGTALVTITPYLSGGVLFLVLISIFLSCLSTLRKIRKDARKSLAVSDTYAAIAIISVLGYLISACVATFQPGANPLELWSNAALVGMIWLALYYGGSFIGTLYRAGAKN